MLNTAQHLARCQRDFELSVEFLLDFGRLLQLASKWRTESLSFRERSPDLCEAALLARAV